MLFYLSLTKQNIFAVDYIDSKGWAFPGGEFIKVESGEILISLNPIRLL